MFQNKVIVITGGAKGIGKCIGEEFTKQGAHVCIIDCVEGDHYVGDIAEQTTLEHFARSVIAKYGRVDVLVNNAPPSFLGIDECSYEQFQRSLAIGVTAPFYLSKLFAPYFSDGASIINISSSRDRMSQPQSESYTAAKGLWSIKYTGAAASTALPSTETTSVGVTSMLWESAGMPLTVTLPAAMSSFVSLRAAMPRSRSSLSSRISADDGPNEGIGLYGGLG